MSAWDEAVTLAAAVERDQRLGRADSLGPYTALVTVERDGTTRAACSCGGLDESGHPDTREHRRALQRLSSHMQLHATAGAQGVPWDVVQAELRRRVLR